MIVIEDVHKRYLTDHGPGPWVLSGVNLAIPCNATVGLIGGNGAGKSTLLRIIGGTDQPTKGRVHRGCRVSWPMGLGGGLHRNLTGRQNAKFVCRVYSPEEEVDRLVAQIEEFAGIGRYFDEPVKTYSSGMRSRLQFALSMSFDFDVYILDELTVTGDAEFRGKVSSVFKDRAKHSGLIMVSHSDRELKQYCESGVFLHEGKAQWFDRIDDAFAAYYNTLGDAAREDYEQRLARAERKRQRMERRRLQQEGKEPAARAAGKTKRKKAAGKTAKAAKKTANKVAGQQGGPAT